MGATCSQCCGSKPSITEVEERLDGLKEKLLDPQEVVHELTTNKDKDHSAALVLSMERTASNDSLNSDEDGGNDSEQVSGFGAAIHPRSQEELDQALNLDHTREVATDGLDRLVQRQDDSNTDDDDQKEHMEDSSSSQEGGSPPPPPRNPPRQLREQQSVSFSASLKDTRSDSYASNKGLTNYTSEVFGTEERIDHDASKNNDRKGDDKVEDDEDGDNSGEDDADGDADGDEDGDDDDDDGDDDDDDGDEDDQERDKAAKDTKQDKSDDDSSDGDISVLVDQRSSSRSPRASPSGRRSSPHRR